MLQSYAMLTRNITVDAHHLSPVEIHAAIDSTIMPFRFSYIFFFFFFFSVHGAIRTRSFSSPIPLSLGHFFFNAIQFQYSIQILRMFLSFHIQT